MPKTILICDDSRMARKQLARCLPDDWPVEIIYAEHGREAIEIIQDSIPDLMFLDLNMPVFDGYETLEELNRRAIEMDILVVSGDIQPTAQERVLELGALDFVKKPISKEILLKVLQKHGFVKSHNPRASLVLADSNVEMSEKEFIDAMQEISNVAMGRAGDVLARFLDVFVELPIPKVNHIELTELHMALQFSAQDETVSSVCQGFIGPGLSGEALLIFNDSSFKNIASLMKYNGEINEKIELELLMDIANILVGACLQGISDQLDINLSQGHPIVLGQHLKVKELIDNNVKNWDKALSIEINYRIENKGINCDLLLLFTESCVVPLKKLLQYIV
ncbi:MAG: response regulator [Kangiella sp.]|nr:MAG: response regulator [Kangiella sp.]